MAKRIMLSIRYGSYLPVLIQALRKTTGDVLELGGGVYSTHYLHWICTMDRRFLTTYENSLEWYEWIKTYSDGPYHLVKYVDNWDEAKIGGSWDIALVDLSPDLMRKEMAKRLADNTRYIILHDSNGRYNKVYHYDEIYPLFKYMWTFDKIEPSTTVLSNLVPLDDFWK